MLCTTQVGGVNCCQKHYTFRLSGISGKKLHNLRSSIGSKQLSSAEQSMHTIKYSVSTRGQARDTQAHTSAQRASFNCGENEITPLFCCCLIPRNEFVFTLGYVVLQPLSNTFTTHPKEGLFLWINNFPIFQSHFFHEFKLALLFHWQRTSQPTHLGKYF